MMDDEDRELLRAWRDDAQEVPGELLDRRILKAARAHEARQRLLPLAVSLAACLMLTFYTLRPQQIAPPGPPLDTSTFGLYEGRGYAEARQQITIRQKPGGFGTDEAVSP